MVFTSHTPRFQILLASRHYPVLFLWRRGRGGQFLAIGHILKPPNKYIFMLKLTLKKLEFEYSYSLEIIHVAFLYSHNITCKL